MSSPLTTVVSLTSFDDNDWFGMENVRNIEQVDTFTFNVIEMY